jgi:hypothetical protein
MRNSSWALLTASVLLASFAGLSAAQKYTPVDPTQEYTESQMDLAIAQLMGQAQDENARQAILGWARTSDIAEMRKFFSGQTSIPYVTLPKGKKGFPHDIWVIANDGDVVHKDHHVIGQDSCKKHQPICHKTTLNCTKGQDACTIDVSDCDYSGC